MPPATVDESRIPAMGQKVVAIVDPLVGNEESQGLVLDYGKYLGYFSSDGFRIWDHGVLIAPTRVEKHSHSGTCCSATCCATRRHLGFSTLAEKKHVNSWP